MKNLQNGLFTILISLLVLSCTKDEIEQESSALTIDLNLANETDWQMADEILVLVNEHRVSIGKATISKDITYASAYATNHTKHMISTQSVNHDNFEVRSQALKQQGAKMVAENVAYGYTNAQDVVNAWLQSPSHKSIIEGPYSRCGFGILKDDQGRNFYTQLFYKK